MGDIRDGLSGFNKNMKDVILAASDRGWVLLRGTKHGYVKCPHTGTEFRVSSGGGNGFKAAKRQILRHEREKWPQPPVVQAEVEEVVVVEEEADEPVEVPKPPPEEFSKKPVRGDPHVCYWNSSSDRFGLRRKVDGIDGGKAKWVGVYGSTPPKTRDAAVLLVLQYDEAWLALHPPEVKEPLKLVPPPVQKKFIEPGSNMGFVDHGRAPSVEEMWESDLAKSPEAMPIGVLLAELRRRLGGKESGALDSSWVVVEPLYTHMTSPRGDYMCCGEHHQDPQSQYGAPIRWASPAEFEKADCPRCLESETYKIVSWALEQRA